MKTKILFAGGLLLFAGAVAGGELFACATIAPVVMTKGAQLVREGKSAEAIVELNKGLADGYNNRGEAYQIAGRWDEAFADFNKAVELNPNDSRPYQGRAQYYMKKGDLDTAIAELDKSIAINDQFSVWAYSLHAWLHNVKDDLDIALTDYTVLLKSKPQDPVLLWRRGFVYYEKGDADKSLADFNGALAVDPKLPVAYLGRSLAYGLKGEKKLAQKDLEKVRELNKGLADEYVARAKDLRNHELFRKAQEYLKYAFLINPALEKKNADLIKELESGKKNAGSGRVIDSF